MELPVMTVRLKHSKSRAEVTINTSDFDPAQHMLLDEPEAAAHIAPPVSVPAPVVPEKDNVDTRTRGQKK